ncbi:exoribonuclease R [Amycolatopsis endophytica]|uniref:Exoribonuclease R n=1 Tax=Amycolatopsis endophytica TaxID=860233 RepID=A0A853AXF6_9PSEU|nr:RNB domain-containing ribonuclease [Amycolatopsis endophytica]NYI87378.1 exoribonuclease R [Amycolatopsis endophytica]
MTSTNSADGGFARLRAEFELPEDFHPSVLAEAETVVMDPSVLAADRADETDLPLVTLDPAGAKDLDQAVLIERSAGGFRVRYAIADLAAFVAPGGPIDRESRRRGQTLYLPDGTVPLHPPVLSEGAASLLPGEIRPAVLWTLHLDRDGELLDAEVRRALVRSTEQLDYASSDPVALHPSIAALPEVGTLRRELAVRRGAVEPQLPDRMIGANGGDWVLGMRPRTRLEAWNAEISLLTGMAGARMMIDAKIGLLRTLPEPDAETLDWLRGAGRALGIDWASGTSVAELLAGLDPRQPESMAFYTDTTRLLRGAGYTSFDGELPETVTHAGIGAPYAHVTAPIRRLADRFAAEICVAVSAGEPVPAWARDALAGLPGQMSASDLLAARVEKACLDQVEAWTLAGRTGETFEAVVLRAEENRAEIMLADPPVMAKCAGENLPEGRRIAVRLTAVDVDKRKVSFERA